MEQRIAQRLLEDIQQALTLAAKCGTEKTVLTVYFEGSEYKGVKLKDWEKKNP